MRAPTSARVRRLFPSSLDGASELQRELAALVRAAPLARAPRYVAGADVSYDRRSDRLYAAVTLFDATSFELLAVGRHEGRVRFPYVPGYLSYREGPAILAALSSLGERPDLLLCDGQGRAHPRRLGLASHLGVALDLPTIGVGKSRLVGSHRTPGPRRGATTRLVHRGELVGLVVRTRDRVRPVYVSVGHLVDLPAARRIVLAWCRPYRLPDPIRAADREAARIRLLSAPRSEASGRPTRAPRRDGGPDE
ncbi:MAG: endonuclease V [Acidobacteriota bacterium]|nr:endonuclease V [Acidobacteriota bacterium]